MKKDTFYGIILSLIVILFMVELMTGLVTYGLGMAIMAFSDLVFKLSMLLLDLGFYLKML